MRERTTVIHPFLGELEPHELGLVSSSIVVPAFARPFRFVLECDPARDSAGHEIDAAIHNVLAAGPDLLTAVTEDLRAYRADMIEAFDLDGQPPLASASVDPWTQVHFGDTIYVRRRSRGNGSDGVYLSIASSCEWDPEHGLQLVLRDGREITKLGGFDGHLTNVDAYARHDFEGVVYVRDSVLFPNGELPR